MNKTKVTRNNVEKLKSLTNTNKHKSHDNNETRVRFLMLQKCSLIIGEIMINTHIHDTLKICI
jgi:hypothetical protein